jgi:FAD/FMN-containing dehydrogenase
MHEACANLAAVSERLDAYGEAAHLFVDVTEIHDLGDYTGIPFEAADPDGFGFARTLIETRRNVSPKRLVEPGPSPQQFEALVSLAAAAPDHGLLTPWRFIHVPTEQRHRLAEVFALALVDRDPGATQEQIESAREKAHRAPLLLIAVDGHPRDVEERAAAMARFCEEQGADPVLRARTPEEAEQLWKARKAISPALKKAKPFKVSEDVVVPLGVIPELITGLEEISRSRGLIIPCYGHAGDGNIHVNVLYDRGLPEETAAVGPTVEDIFVLVRKLEGTLSGEHGVGLTKAPYLGMELSPAAIDLQKRLKRAFDPHNIMNPGKNAAL